MRPPTEGPLAYARGPFALQLALFTQMCVLGSNKNMNRLTISRELERQNPV